MPTRTEPLVDEHIEPERPRITIADAYPFAYTETWRTTGTTMRPEPPREPIDEAPFYTRPRDMGLKKKKITPSKKKNFVGCTVKFLSNIQLKETLVEKGSKAVVKAQYGKGVIVEVETKQGTKQVPVPFNKVKIQQTLKLDLKSNKKSFWNGFDEDFEQHTVRNGASLRVLLPNGNLRHMQRQGDCLVDLATSIRWVFSEAEWAGMSNDWTFHQGQGGQLFLDAILSREGAVRQGEGILRQIQNNAVQMVDTASLTTDSIRSYITEMGLMDPNEQDNNH